MSVELTFSKIECSPEVPNMIQQRLLATLILLNIKRKKLRWCATVVFPPGLKSENNLLTNCIYLNHFPAFTHQAAQFDAKKKNIDIYSRFSDIFLSNPMEIFVEHFFPSISPPKGLAGKPWRCKTSTGKMGLAGLRKMSENLQVYSG